MIYPCILSGGSGTRLWPVSRNYAPKQLQPLLSDRSMIRDTALRFDAEAGFAPASVICNTAYAQTIAEDFAHGRPELAAVIAEPGRRDTAAAAALAAFHVRGADPDGYVLLLPSDHHIRRPADFAAAIRAASADARDAINTFGVIPTRPDTGFGYIKRSDTAAQGILHAVEAFVEKPDAATAQTYLAQGGYFWNAGIFLYRPETFLAELKRFHPGIHNAVEQAWAERAAAPHGQTTIHTPSQRFLDSAAISLDYAVMERTDRATVMPVDIGWDDLGSWSAMRDFRGADADGNVVRGDAHLSDCRNTYVEAGSRLVVATGVSDIIVVDTADALLVCGADSANAVKSVHGQLVAAGRAEADYHPDTSSRRLALRDWYRSWLVEDVLPLWSGDAAIDARTGLPQEALGYDGRPVDDTVRTRVLSRQIFTFAFAADKFGWDPARAKELITSLTDTYLRLVRIGTGSVARLDRNAKVLDDKWDTYDQAFHLLAMAWGYKVTGQARFADLGAEALAELNSALKHPQAGYLEDAQGSTPRRANPHMHLLETALAWLDTDRRAAFAPLARETVSLFHDAFCRKGLLFERFDDSLSAVDDPDSETAIEPGHLLEWATLIKLAAAEGVGAEDAGRVAAMVAFSDVYGENAQTGLVYDTCAADGTRHSGTHRLWPQTEKVRHHLLFGTPAQEQAALSTLEAIRRDYLDPGGAKGLWRDKLDESGADLGDRAPASTLYHLINMIAVI